MRRVLLTAIALLGPAVSALAGTGADPFGVMGPIDTIVEFFTGPFAFRIGILALFGAALAWWKARSEGGEAAERLIKWVIGFALAIGAPAIVLALGFAAAVV